MEEFDKNVSSAELREKLEEYSTFLSSKLYPELKRTVAAREETEAEIKDYQELHAKLSILGNETGKPLEAMVNLGYELVYCKAQVDDPSTVYVDVGKGFFVELTIEEALPVIEKRISFLQKEVLVKRVQDASRVASHLQSSLMIVEALSKHLQEIEDE